MSACLRCVGWLGWLFDLLVDLVCYLLVLRCLLLGLVLWLCICFEFACCSLLDVFRYACSWSL